MCCCGKPVVNGEMGYKWQPNDTPSVHQPFPPELEENETLVFDEPGRCGGLDCHSHHFRLVKKSSSRYYLLIAHGGGDERFELFSLAPSALAGLDSTARYWMFYTIFRAHRDGADRARDAESFKWRQAAAEKRIKTQKQRGRDAVKVWIETAA